MTQLLRHYVLTVGRTAIDGGEKVRLVRPLRAPLELALGNLERANTLELTRLYNDIGAELNDREVADQ